jgi:hypothetical protein
MRTISYLILLTILATVFAVGSVFRNKPRAESDGREITVTWDVYNDANVLRYEVERVGMVGGQGGWTTEGNFTFVGNVDAGGLASYRFVDNTVFMKVTSAYSYRIKAVYPADMEYSLASDVVNHLVSGVRRTWGSIKALFR